MGHDHDRVVALFFRQGQNLAKGPAYPVAVLVSRLPAGAGAQAQAVHPGPVIGVIFHFHIVAAFKGAEVHLMQVRDHDLVRLREQDGGCLPGPAEGGDVHPRRPDLCPGQFGAALRGERRVRDPLIALFRLQSRPAVTDQIDCFCRGHLLPPSYEQLITIPQEAEAALRNRDLVNYFPGMGRCPDQDLILRKMGSILSVMTAAMTQRQKSGTTVLKNQTVISSLMPIPSVPGRRKLNMMK